MQSDQRDITREARVDEEANELPDLAAVFGIRFANDSAGRDSRETPRKGCSKRRRCDYDKDRARSWGICS
jgi:hypothetical protein